MKSYLRDPGDGDGHALLGVHAVRLDDARHRVQGEPADLVEARDDQGPPARQDGGQVAMAGPRDEDDLAGVGVHDAPVEAHGERGLSSLVGGNKT